MRTDDVAMCYKGEWEDEGHSLDWLGGKSSLERRR